MKCSTLPSGGVRIETNRTQRNGERMKPRCRSIQHHLSDYIDYTLSGRQTVIVAHHLRSCRVCQREVESLKRTKTLLNLYTQPSLPDFYDGLFWHQLQRAIEKSHRPIWWEAIVLWQVFAWRCQEVLDHFAGFSDQHIRPPIQWVCSRVRYAPVYVWVLCATCASLLAYQFLQPQEKHLLDSTILQHSLRADPFHFIPRAIGGGENRELIQNRERITMVSQFIPEQWEREVPADATRKTLSRALEAVELTGSLEWEGYISRLVSDGDALKAVTTRDVSSDFLAFAQLSSPESIGAKEDFSRPLGGVKLPSEVKVERYNRRSNRFVEMLTNVPLPSLSITAVYDSIKL